MDVYKELRNSFPIIQDIQEGSTILPNGDMLFFSKDDPAEQIDDPRIISVLEVGTTLIDNEVIYYAITAPVPGLPIDDYISYGNRLDLRNIERQYEELARILLVEYELLPMSEITYTFNIDNGVLRLSNPFRLVQRRVRNNLNAQMAEVSDIFYHELQELISMNATRKFILNNPNLPYNLDILSNSDIIKNWPEVLVSRLPDARAAWDWDVISETVPRRFVLEHPNLPWDLNVLSGRNDFTEADQALRFPNATGSWAFDAMDERDAPLYVVRSRPIDVMRQNPYFSANTPGIAFRDINRSGGGFRRSPADIVGLISMDEIRRNPQIQWSRSALSGKAGIRMSDLDLPGTVGEWNYSLLSAVLPMEDIRRNPELPWNRVYLSRNPEITLKDVQELDLPNAYGEWNWFDLSRNLPMDDIRANPHLPVMLSSLSDHPELTQKDVLFIELPNAGEDWNVGILKSRGYVPPVYPPLR